MPSQRKPSEVDGTKYPPRIQALRELMVKAIPRVPNNRESLEYLKRLRTSDLILAYLSWRMRLVPAKPRQVKAWSGGLDIFRFLEIRQRLQPLLSKVEAGEDLTQHLSDLVRTSGFTVPNGQDRKGWAFDDLVLARMGLHHFHVGEVSAANPKGRSGQLVFAEVTETDFTIIAYLDHDVFNSASDSFRRFLGICNSYIQKDMVPGTAYMHNPVTVSGHPVVLVEYADACEMQMRRLDAELDTSAFIDKLYADTGIDRPGKIKLKWHFEDLNFGLIEPKTGTFFCIYSYFTR